MEMSVSAGITAPVQICRRLFGEPVSCIRIQQTLETIIRKDLDRFQNKWNFQLPNILSENKIRKPLSLHQFHNGNLQKNAINEFTLEPVQSPPSFYTKLPRKLKACRRLPVSVAQKTRMELINKSTEGEIKEFPYSFNGKTSYNFASTIDDSSDNQKSEFNIPLSTTESNVTVVPHEPLPAPSSTSYKVNIASQVIAKTSTAKMSPITPIIILPDGDKNDTNNMMLPSSSNSPQHSVKLIKSNRLSLKKSGPKISSLLKDGDNPRNSS
ncbi:hypothetical protein KSF78_0003509 [Schistosoma japonicum]|nr:hypothetical protein KSF78_0003509 [Schistosoma japonicum]KAH8866785.1 hypothetical protein KSF78_0003509 [Schistosoma japonicum]